VALAVVLVFLVVVNAPSQTTHGVAPSVTAYEASKVVIALLIVARLALATVLAAAFCDLLSSAVADAVTNPVHVEDKGVKVDVSDPVLRVVAVSRMVLIGQLV